MAYDAEDGSVMAASLSGGPARRLPGPPVDRDDQIVTWSADGRYLYLVRFRPGLPGIFFRREISTGKTARWLEFQPADPTGVITSGRHHHARRAFVRVQLRTRRGVRPLRRRRPPLTGRFGRLRRGGRGVKPRPRQERRLTVRPGEHPGPEPSVRVQSSS